MHILVVDRRQVQRQNQSCIDTFADTIICHCVLNNTFMFISYSNDNSQYIVSISLYFIEYSIYLLDVRASIPI